MDNDAYEDEEFTLKEPSFHKESSFRPPKLPESAWRRDVGALLIMTAAFIAATVLGDLTARVLTKWLD